MAKKIMYNRGIILSCDMRDFSKYYVIGKYGSEYAVNFAYAIIPFIITQTNYFSLTHDFIL